LTEEPSAIYFQDMQLIETAVDLDVAPADVLDDLRDGDLVDLDDGDLIDLDGRPEVDRPSGVDRPAVDRPSVVDRPAVARAIADLLRALGRDPEDPHLAATPRRVAAAYAELLTPVGFDLTTFPNEERYDQLVLATGIPIHSLCRHHLLPFRGVAHIGYLPGDRILGLSKLARVAERFARDLQVQERLTQQIADWLDDRLAPRGVGVMITAEHSCMTLRGVRASGSRTTTSAWHGQLRSDARARAEFLALAGQAG
jgi:GTP cyclohydrolase I